MNENRVLTIDNLTTTFKSHKQKIQAVRGVSLYVKEGDILAIVGESGSGKSVTMKSVMGLLGENAEIQADPAQLRRVLRNLISNALTHGQGTLFIYQKGNTLSFVNETKTWETVHPKLLFERFYRTDQARQGNHAGLGLMLKMQGNICAESKDGRLWITLTFAKEKTGV